VNEAADGEHFMCPFCNSNEVDRLYLASLVLDSCACLSCGARWDEDARSGEFRGRSSRSSVMAPRDA
jgi:transcription elongation factor Elf1